MPKIFFLRPGSVLARRAAAGGPLAKIRAMDDSGDAYEFDFEEEVEDTERPVEGKVWYKRELLKRKVRGEN